MGIDTMQSARRSAITRLRQNELHKRQAAQMKQLDTLIKKTGAGMLSRSKAMVYAEYAAGGKSKKEAAARWKDVHEQLSSKIERDIAAAEQRQDRANLELDTLHHQ